MTTMVEAPSLRARKRARAHAELVRTALRLFERQGFAATTVDQIVTSAEYSPSTFFRYFGTKEDVLFADLDQHLAELARLLSENLGTGTIWDAVVRSVEATTAGFIAADPEFGARRVELWMSEPSLRARYIEHAAIWEKTIEDAVSQHRGRRSGADVYASVVALAAVSAFRIAVESIPATHGEFRVRLHQAFEILGAGVAIPPPD
jgi:AcrR family transcriptional regulator